MIQTTLGIDGMMCSMCEAHINDTIRREFAVMLFSCLSILIYTLWGQNITSGPIFL